MIHQARFSTTDLCFLDPCYRNFLKEEFEQYCDEIKCIANGGSIKAAENFKLLKHVEEKFYACPSQGHFVEGGVKDAAFTGQTGAEERRRSNMAIIRSHTVRITKAMSTAKQKHTKEGKSHRPHGSKLTSTFLNVVDEQFNRALDPQEQEEAKRLLSPSYQFKETRHKGKVLKVTTSRKKTLNIAQRKQEVDFPCAAQGLVSYSALRFSVYVGTVTNELNARSVKIPVGTGIRELIKLLKMDENRRHDEDPTHGTSDEGFKPITKINI